MAKLEDGVVGAMALDIAKNNKNATAVRLLREAVAVNPDSYGDRFGKAYFGLVLVLPLDFMDMLDQAAATAIRQAANRAGQYSDFVWQRLAPAEGGWRDRLSELEDWGEQGVGDTWAVINERVHDLRSLFQRAVTPDDRADIGRRCRELMIAAASATYRPSMLPADAQPPKESDAKTKSRLIVESVGSNSVDARLNKLIDKAWDLAVGLSHHEEPAPVATYGAAQATILVVRTLAMIEAQLRESSSDDDVTPIGRVRRQP